MSARAQFIGRISKALGRRESPATVPPFIPRHSVERDLMKNCSRDELARLFVENSKTVGIDVTRTTKAELNESIRAAAQEFNPGPVILADHPLFDELDTAAALEPERAVQVWSAGNSREDNIRFAEEASVGIAVAKMALSESATVLLFSHKGCGRSVTLLPESVIYVIAESRIRPRLTQGMEFLRQCKEDLPSSVNFVSGPSATSDIELVRVVGVHGPVRVFHIVVSDM